MDEIKEELDAEKEGREKDDEKFQFEIPIKKTIFVIIAVVVLSFVFFAWEDIKITGGVILGSEIAEYKKECKTQCELGNQELYCCFPRGIYIGEENIVYTCQDKKLEISCKLNCDNVCFNLCSNISSMMPCAQAGCSWIVKDYRKTGGGFCVPKLNT